VNDVCEHPVDSALPLSSPLRWFKPKRALAGRATSFGRVYSNPWFHFFLFFFFFFFLSGTFSKFSSIGLSISG
jgi:hypothetical protein